MLEITGVPTEAQIRETFPPIEAIDKGPIAVIECFQEIPCNPCATSCRFGAIYIGDNINNLPTIDIGKCTGCSICLTKCPGLAISIIDGSKSKDYVHFSIPYEMTPLPATGDMVRALDREGRYLIDVKVLGVRSNKNFDRTNIVTLEVPRDQMYRFRSISLEVIE
ncbi:MAG: 4Fe-4S binding protein [Eubacteriales bacterium]|nr:4Fe-4S binding protein [Eubacteriales bacterium]